MNHRGIGPNMELKEENMKDDFRYDDIKVDEELVQIPKKDLVQMINKDYDNVNHPAHYTFGKFEVIEVIEDWNLDFCLANCIKYVARAKHKNNEIEDLQKAQWYLARRIKQLTKE